MKLKNPVNIILLAISFVIFGGLGMIFITQMELLPGYSWDDLQNRHPVELSLQLANDLNEDGKEDIITNAFPRSIEIDELTRFSNQDPTFGGVYAINGQSGGVIWEQTYETPVIKVMSVGDINSDGFQDFFNNRVMVNSSWGMKMENRSGELVEVYEPQIIHNDFSNQIMSGENGEFLSESLTNWLVSDVIRIGDLGDDLEDFILLEGKYTEYSNNYIMNISTYFLNGTRTRTIEMDAYIYSDLRGEFSMPALKEFPYKGTTQALFIDYDTIILFNTSKSSFMDQIYNKTALHFQQYSFIEDLNLDGVPEIIIASEYGNVSILSGVDGTLIQDFVLPTSSWNLKIDEIGNPLGDHSTYILIKNNDYNNKEFYTYIYSISLTERELIWEYFKPYGDQDERPRLFPLSDDLTGDDINEIILIYRYQPAFPFSTDVRRYVTLNFITDEELGIVNSDRWIESPINIPDFDGDGIKDFAFEDGLSIYAIATQKPYAIWQSPLFDLGMPLFILLASILLIGIIILLINVKKLKPKRERLRQSKMAVTANIISIAITTISFSLFLFLLNVFNRTLIAGDPMTNITIVYLTTTIVWFGLLPLTAAIFNQFAARFAYGFIKLRNFFFKFSRNYKHAIFVEDLQGRFQLSTTIRLKRVILPMLLSISIGFYTYNTLAPILGYLQDFDTFGGQEFFSFMIGYNLLCILPMILSFIVFSFFISGNYMLDDAGIAYYLESKKHRRPGDVEPISIWSQSIIKGIAGFSAIITFVSFFQTVDLSGLYTQTGDDPMISFFFGLFISIAMFYGTPFLTSFAYILFAIEIMDFSYENNTEKLYRIMKKHGYDTTPRSITNLFPSGYERLREDKNLSKKREK